MHSIRRGKVCWYRYKVQTQPHRQASKNQSPAGKAAPSAAYGMYFAIFLLYDEALLAFCHNLRYDVRCVL